MRLDNEHNFCPGNSGIQIPESEKCLVLESGIWDFYLVESGILDFEIHNTAQGNRNGTNHWNPESRIRDCLGFFYMGLITLSCFLKNHSNAGKKSNFWDKENVWALKHYTTILLYGRSRLRAKSVTRFIDMRPVYCSDKLKNVLRV